MLASLVSDPGLRVPERSAAPLDAPPTAPVIALEDVGRRYAVGLRASVEALVDIDLEVHPDEFVVVLGPSGSGRPHTFGDKEKRPVLLSRASLGAGLRA